MELVGAGAGGDVNCGAEIAAVFGAEKAGHHFEFAEEFDGRGAVAVGGVVEGVSSGNAIDEQVIGTAAGAVDAHGIGAGAGVIGIEDGADDAGGDAENLGEIAGGEGDGLNGALFDDLADGRLFALQEWSFGGDINGVGDLADVQGDIDAGAFGGIDDDHLLDALEAFAFDGQTVSPGAEKRELIRAIRVRCRAELGGVFLIDGGDGGAHDDGAC